MLKIKELRKEKNISQKELSEKIGIDNSQLSKIEKGKMMPTLHQLMEISSIFNVSLDWLIGREELKEPINQDPSAANNDKYITLLEAQVKDKEAIIKEKEEKEAMYKEKIMALENELQEYKNLKKGYQQEEEEEDEIIEILPMAAEPAPIPAELLKAKQGEYRRI